MVFYCNPAWQKEIFTDNSGRLCLVVALIPTQKYFVCQACILERIFMPSWIMLLRPLLNGFMAIVAPNLCCYKSSFLHLDKRLFLFVVGHM